MGDHESMRPPSLDCRSPPPLLVPILAYDREKRAQIVAWQRSPPHLHWHRAPARIISCMVYEQGQKSDCCTPVQSSRFKVQRSQGSVINDYAIRTTQYAIRTTLNLEL